MRTPIQLTEARALKAQARMEERSISEPMRECIAEHPTREHAPDTRELARRAHALKGRFHSAIADLAEAHDRHLDSAFDP